MSNDTARVDSSDTPTAGDTEGMDDREISFSRRALIRAGWSIPVVMAVTPPRVFAVSPHQDSLTAHNDGAAHNDSLHTDTINHSDNHDDDIILGNHSDLIPHADTPLHSDAPLVHTDSAHSDSGAVHTDGP